jgi:hypothetical protein
MELEAKPEYDQILDHKNVLFNLNIKMDESR